MSRLVTAGVLLLAGVLPSSAAAAATSCPVPAPGAGFERVTPAAAGMDAAVLARAVHALQDRRSYAIRVLRHGCLVGEDTNASANRRAQYEGWELTTSIVSLLFGRAMELGLVDPADPVGALVPQADAAHGGLRLGDLLARSAGLEGEPDDLALRDRLRRGLLRPVVAPAFGDAPVGATLVASALQAAVGQDLQVFAQRELFGPLGLPAGSWAWTRDATGLTDATFGLQMTADAYARIGELLRRDGVWGSRRLIAERWAAGALRPTAHNPCFGWSVWLNREPSCSGTGHRLLGGAPADLVQLRGRFDQRITLLPALDLVIVRTGTNAADSRAGDDAFTWERGVTLAFAGAVRDADVAKTAVEPGVLTDTTFREDPLAPVTAPPPLPAPGPLRARPVVVDPDAVLRGRRRVRAVVRLRCPAVGARSCAGAATLEGALGPRTFALSPGDTTTLTFRLRRRDATPANPSRAVRAEVRDDAGASVTDAVVALRR